MPLVIASGMDVTEIVDVFTFAEMGNSTIMGTLTAPSALYEKNPMQVGVAATRAACDSTGATAFEGAHEVLGVGIAGEHELPHGAVGAPEFTGGPCAGVWQFPSDVAYRKAALVAEPGALAQ